MARKATTTIKSDKSGASCCMCFNLRKAARAVTQLYDEAFRVDGIRATQLSILGPVQAMGPLTISRLAEVTVTDRTTLTRNLKLLQERGFIRTEPGEDRREHQVALTERGRTILKKAYPQWERLQERVTARLGRARMQRLLTDLEAVVEVSHEA